jgi:phosphoribosylaminoimidazolecarboxamide formyltransferase/IMP cyclohydrolase
VAFNRTPTQKVFDVLSKKFVEVVVLPKNADSKVWAENFYKARPNSKVFLYDREQLKQWDLETFSSLMGTLIQQRDRTKYDGEQKTFEGLERFFAIWTAACSKSNAITLIGNTPDKKLFFLAGAGQGQPNRVESLEKLAIPRAQDFCFRRGYGMNTLLCSSDAFFPFDDILHALSAAKIARVLQPGGSKNDGLVMETAKKLGITIDLTGERHFWH